MKLIVLLHEIDPEWKPGDRLVLTKTRFGTKLLMRTWEFEESEFPALKGAKSIGQAVGVVHHQLVENSA